MAAGKPIVGAIDGETPTAILEAECGLCVESENAKGLADSIRQFVEMKREQLAINARAYYEEHFGKTIFMDKLENALVIRK